MVVVVVEWMLSEEDSVMSTLTELNGGIFSSLGRVPHSKRLRLSAGGPHRVSRMETRAKVF